MNYLFTKGGIHMVLNGEPVTLAKSDKHFGDVVDALKRNATDTEVQAILDTEKLRMEAAVQVAPGINIKGGQLYYQEEAVAGVLGERMSQMLDEGFDLGPMGKFLHNLMQNPSKRVVDHLYPFLEHGKNPITEDGCFLAYKAVQENYTDIRTGTFDNSIGRVVRMPRNRVDEDPNQTCSYGLHVCSYDYLPHFSHANGHVMVCKINPANVVAIPTDYNNTKMRVCEYEVVDEYKGYYENQGDTLSATSVATGLDDNFIVDIDTGSGYHREGGYERLSEAADRMEELLEDSDIKRVRIVNAKTGQTADEEDNDDFDDGADGDERYDVIGIQSGGGRIQLAGGFDNLQDAVMEALDYDDGTYARLEIVDQDDKVVKTLS